MATIAKEASWRWEGHDHRGERVRGRLSATTLPLARAELRRRGIAPIRVRREHQPRGKRIRPNDIAYISRQLATMITAGVPIAQSFAIIGQGHDNRRMQGLCFEIRTDIEAGSALSQALAKHPKYFDHLYVSLVATGEQSGQLDQILDRIATYKEKTESLKRKIKKALLYPAAVITAAIIVTAILLIFVIPKFQDFYSSFGASLPAFTRWVIGISYSAQHYGWIYILAFILLIVAIIQLRKRSLGFHRGMDRVALRLPVLGTILRKAAIARFARTLSITFSAGVPITDALTTVARSTGNVIYEEAIMRASKRIAGGERLHRALEETVIFPNMVTQMIAIGEEAGAVDDMSGKVADFYEEEVDTLVDGLSTLLEPVIIVVLGVIVGA
ncbi:MAG: type II secretion system F family protein, partial [Gammaproteobacteria bacterium]